MKIKNPGGSLLRAQLSPSAYVELAAGATTTVDDNPDTVAKAQELELAGTIQIVGAPAGSGRVQVNSKPRHIAVVCGSGAAIPADTNTLTIAGEVFEFDTDDTYTAGRTQVDINGLTAATDVAEALKDAIDANETLAALGVVTGDIINADGAGTDLRAVLLLDLTGVTSDEDMTPAVSTSASKLSASLNAAAEATARMVVLEVAATGISATASWYSATGLKSIVAGFATVRTAAGVQKAFDGVLTFQDSLVAIDTSGSADVGATDIISLVLFGY